MTTRNGPKVELERRPVARSERRSLHLTERMDLYIGAVATLMFLAGCVLTILSVRERSQERRRQRGYTVAKPRAPAESKPL